MSRTAIITLQIVAGLLAANLVFLMAEVLPGWAVLRNAPVLLFFMALAAVIVLSFVVAAILRKPMIPRLVGRVVLIAVFVATLVAVPLWQIAGADQFDVKIRQALIAAIVVAAGWLVTFLVQEYRLESERERKRMDVQKAVRTEIELHYLDVYDTDWGQLCLRMEAEFFKDSRYTPFVPRRDRDRFLSDSLDRIELLSDNQIVQVMRYYELAERLELMNEDIRSDRYREMPVAKRQSFALRLLELEETCMRYALQAIECLASRRYFADFAARHPVCAVSKTDLAQ
jgi:hypothetical protein